MSASGPCPAAMPGQPQERVPLRHLGVVELEHRGRVVRDVAGRELVERQVVVRAVERRGRGQDHVRVPGGLVDVDVDAHHQVDVLERAAHAAGVGSAHDGVSGEREERAHLTVARRVDLLGEARDGQLADCLRQAADAGAPAGHAHALALARSAARVGGAGSGLREHRAARPVEVAGHDVEHVDEPARERPELLGAGADPPVDGGAVGAGQLARHAADLGRVDPACLRRGLGSELAGRSPGPARALRRERRRRRGRRAPPRRSR